MRSSANLLSGRTPNVISPFFALQPFPLLWLWVTNGDCGAMVILFCTNDMHRKTLGTTIPLLSKVHYLVRLDSYLSFD